MSWTVSVKDTPERAKLQVTGDDTLPKPIKDYIVAGIDALVKNHGEELKRVAVSGQGHLHNGSKGDYETTTASINVYLPS